MYMFNIYEIYCSLQHIMKLVYYKVSKRLFLFGSKFTGINQFLSTLQIFLHGAIFYGLCSCISVKNLSNRVCSYYTERFFCKILASKMSRNLRINASAKHLSPR